MSAKKPHDKAAFDAWAKAQKERVTPLGEEEIEAFRRGELDQEARLDLLERAAFHEEDLDALLEDDTAVPAFNPAHVQSSWEAFGQKLKAEPGLKKNKEAPAVESPGRRATPPAWFLAAACLFLGAAGLVFWATSLRQAPMADAVVREVYFDGTTRSVPGGSVGAPVHTLRIHLPSKWPSYERYLVTLTDADGRDIYAAETDDNGERVLALAIWTRGNGPFKTYRLSVYGLEDGIRGREVHRDLSFPMIE